MTRSALIAREHGGRCAARANSAGVMRGTGSAHALHWVGPVAVVSKEIWPKKTAEHLSAYADCGLRTAKRWLSKKGSISLAHFIAILRGEHGGKFLEAYMSDADAAWWRRQQYVREMADLHRRQAEHEKQLKKITSLFAAD